MHPRPPHPTFTASFDDDADIYCTSCSYNLRGATGRGCPECGSPFVLSAAGRRESYAWYLVALCCTGGLAFSNLYLLYLFAQVLSDPSSLSYYGLIDLVRELGGLPALPYLVLLIIFRRRIVRAHIGVQLAWAIPPLVMCVAEIGLTIFDVVMYY